MTLQENKPEVSWSFQHFFRLMRKVKNSDEKRWSDDIKRACIKVLITSCQGDVKSWLLIFCFIIEGGGGGETTPVHIWSHTELPWQLHHFRIPKKPERLPLAQNTVPTCQCPDVLSYQYFQIRELSFPRQASFSLSLYFRRTQVYRVG